MSTAAHGTQPPQLPAFLAALGGIRHATTAVALATYGHNTTGPAARHRSCLPSISPPPTTFPPPSPGRVDAGRRPVSPGLFPPVGLAKPLLRTLQRRLAAAGARLRHLDRRGLNRLRRLAPLVPARWRGELRFKLDGAAHLLDPGGILAPGRYLRGEGRGAG